MKPSVDANTYLKNFLIGHFISNKNRTHLHVPCVKLHNWYLGVINGQIPLFILFQELPLRREQEAKYRFSSAGREFRGCGQNI